MTEVYFLRDQDAVKVGVATNFRARFNQIQTGNSRSLEIVGTYDVEAQGISSFAFEKQMHRLMKPYHIWREWFKITNEDLEVIRLYALSLCKGLHFRNAPCIVRKTKPMPHANGTSGGKDELPSAQKQLIAASSEKGTQGFESPVGQFKRGPGRPKTITDMRAYKAMKAREYRARPKPATKREKSDE